MKKQLAAVLLAAALALPALADLDVTVRRGAVTATPIAIVPFAVDSSVPQDVAEVIDDDLGHSGLFSTLPRSRMLERPSDPARIDFRNWQVLNQNDLVIGQIHTAPGGGYEISFWLFDVYRGAQLLAFKLPIASTGELRRRGHQIADMVYEQLTGNRGYFDTLLAYVRGRGLGERRTFQLMRSDSDGKNEQVLVNSNEPLMSPAWSPDHTKLAFVGYVRGKQATYIWDVGQQASLLKITSEPGINSAPAWSPDGRQVALTLSYGFNPDIYIVDVATKVKRRMTTNSGIDTEPTWSPDGRRIAFTSDRGGSPQIYEMQADMPNSEPRRLTFSGRQNLRPRYSPDGRTIALVSQDHGRLRIGLLDLASGDVKILTRGPVDESPDWAPNGQVILYARNTERGTELATVSKDGSVDRSLGAAGDLQDPSWSSFLDPDFLK